MPALEALERNKDKFEYIIRRGKLYVAIPYDVYDYNYDDLVIIISETWGHVNNHDIVNLYKGEEFSEYGRLPLPESHSIYEAWHWAPLEPSPKLHEKIIHAAGMVSRKDYWYQDGRPAFYDIHFMRMNRFVKHFTSLDYNAWQDMMAHAPVDGPGMIDAIAHFCSDKPEVRDDPNIFNVINGAHKIATALATGKNNLTSGEIAAMKRGLEDRSIREQFFDFWGSIRSAR